MILVLSEICRRLIRGLHASWLQFIDHGCNLVIDYDCFSVWAVKQLVSDMKQTLGRKGFQRVIIIEYGIYRNGILVAPLECYPEAVIAAAVHNMSEIQKFVASSSIVHKIQVNEGEEKDMLETVLRKISKTRLVCVG